MQYIGDILLLALCGIAAYKLMKWFGPIIAQRRDLTPGEMAERVILAPFEERQRQEKTFGSRKKTLVVTLTNCALMLTWARLGFVYPFILWAGLLYQIAGHIVLYRMRAKVGHNLTGLGLRDRIVLSVFYAWFWPIYLAQWRK